MNLDVIDVLNVSNVELRKLVRTDLINGQRISSSALIAIRKERIMSTALYVRDSGQIA